MIPSRWLSNGILHPVGRKARNFFGLYDVEGNAAEWVQDWYDPGYYASSPSDDPTGPTTGQTIGFRVVREPVSP